jgi:hypothetical protein
MDSPPPPLPLELIRAAMDMSHSAPRSHECHEHMTKPNIINLQLWRHMDWIRQVGGRGRAREGMRAGRPATMKGILGSGDW